MSESPTAAPMRVRKVSVDDLTLDPENVNRHTAESIRRLAELLEAHGQQLPIVVSPDLTVVVGNGRLMAARQLGWKTIKVVETNLSGPQLRAFAIADNRSAGFSSFDEAALARALIDLEQENPSLVAFSGFDEKEHRKALRALVDEEGEEDEGGLTEFGEDGEGLDDQDERNDDAAEIGSGEEPSHRVIVSCSSHDQALAVSRMLRDAGHRCRVVEL